ncbi:MAG: hypothetical protein GX270_10380 [Clostridiaceae bacterium]|nr:hypothetical protein [Clostridiaceae bacterium]
MKIFQLHANADDYNFFELVNKSDWDFKRFNGTRLLESWKSFRVKCARSKKYPVGDLSSISSLHFTLNYKTIGIFENIFINNVELLPIEYIEECYLMNVINIIDALDVDKSEFKRYDDGRIMFCTKYVFKENVIGNNSIFKIPQFPTVDVLVTEEFVRLVEENELKGFVFEELWDSEK